MVPVEVPPLSRPMRTWPTPSREMTRRSSSSRATSRSQPTRFAPVATPASSGKTRMPSSKDSECMFIPNRKEITDLRQLGEEAVERHHSQSWSQEGPC